MLKCFGSECWLGLVSVFVYWFVVIIVWFIVGVVLLCSICYRFITYPPRRRSSNPLTISPTNNSSATATQSNCADTNSSLIVS